MKWRQFLRVQGLLAQKQNVKFQFLLQVSTSQVAEVEVSSTDISTHYLCFKSLTVPTQLPAHFCVCELGCQL